MPFEGAIDDRLMIRELYSAYAAASMEQDRVAYLACWAEDGERIAADAHLRGKAEIAAHWDGIWTMLRQMGFFPEVASTIVDGASATAHVYCREIVVFRDGRIWKVVGRYDDVLEKQDGHWRFKRRAYRIVLDENA